MEKPVISRIENSETWCTVQDCRKVLVLRISFYAIHPAMQTWLRVVKIQWEQNTATGSAYRSSISALLISTGIHLPIIYRPTAPPIPESAGHPHLKIPDWKDP